MSHIYRHKLYGWQIKYHVYYLDGTFRRSIKYSNKKTKALDIFSNAKKLESLSYKQSIHIDEAKYFYNIGLINNDDFQKLVNIHPPQIISWEYLKSSYLEYLKKHTRTKTYYIYNTMLTGIMDFLSLYSINDINIDILGKYQNQRLQEGVASATVNRDFRIIRGMLDIAVLKHVLPANPARKMKYLPEGTDRMPRAIYPNEMDILLKTIKNNKHLCCGKITEIVLVAYYTGMRLGEIVSLTKENIKMGDNLIKVQAYGKGKDLWQPKNNESVRTITIHKDLKPILSGLLKKPGMYLFSIYKYGGFRPFRQDVVSHAIQKIIKKSGLPKDIGFHCLRHTFITNLLEQGVPFKDAQTIAGHADTRTTMKYVHILPKKDSPVNKIPSIKKII